MLSFLSTCVLLFLIIFTVIIIIRYYFVLKLPRKGLFVESKKWVEHTIISEDQQKSILALYPQKKSIDIKQYLPVFLLSIGAILLIVGLFLFYASNWKYMSATFKSTQVFALILIFYGMSFYILNYTTYKAFGRAFLLLGMLSFGLAIALIAQIFHISAHDSTGTLIWLISTITMSWLMKEKWGYYISLALLALWALQNIIHFNNPALLYLAFCGLLFYLFYTQKCATGMILTVISAVTWLVYFNNHTMYQLQYIEDVKRSALWIFIPAGIFFVAFGRILKGTKNATKPGAVLLSIGWIAVYFPLISLSWPYGSRENVFHTYSMHYVFLHVELAIFTIFALAGIVLLRKSQKQILFLAGTLILGITMYLLPQGHQSIMVVGTHISLLLFTSLFIYFLHFFNTSGLEKLLSIILFIIAIIVKGVVFFIFAMDNKSYFIAYIAGSVIYAIIAFLIAQVIEIMLFSKKIIFNTKAIIIASSIASYCAVYILSFKISAQKSIFTAEPVVLILLGIFITVAIILYIFLFIKSKNTILLILSTVTFATLIIILIFSGPSIHWIVYSLVFNILLFSIEATTVYYGLSIQSPSIINIAIVAIILHIVTRYFDTLFDMLSGSLLFITSGIFIILGGYILERKRRQWMKQISEHETAGNNHDE